MRRFRWIPGVLVLAAAAAWAKPTKKAAPKPAPVAVETRTVEFKPWIEGLGGVAVPLSGGAAGAKFGLKAGVFDLGSLFNLAGLHVVADLLVTEAAPTTRFELTPGVEYRRPIGPEHLELYADLLLGYAHRRTIAQAQFTGYTLLTDNAFVGRVAVGVSYEVVERVRLYAEAANIGFFVSSATTSEYAGMLGVSVSL